MIPRGHGLTCERQKSLCHIDFVVESARRFDEILSDGRIVLEFGVQDLEFEFQFVVIERLFECRNDFFGFDEAILRGDGIVFRSFDARFEHELLSAPEGELAAGGAICLRLALRNASGRDGAAVPQLYIHRTQGVATSRARQLVDWKKLRLRAGEGAETELSIPPEALRQWDGAAWVTPPGKIEWFLGDNGEDWASGEFTLSGTSA